MFQEVSSNTASVRKRGYCLLTARWVWKSSSSPWLPVTPSAGNGWKLGFPARSSLTPHRLREEGLPSHFLYCHCGERWPCKLVGQRWQILYLVPTQNACTYVLANSVLKNAESLRTGFFVCSLFHPYLTGVKTKNRPLSSQGWDRPAFFLLLFLTVSSCL